MVDKLLNLALIGGDPILYILLVLSVISIGIALERLVAYLRNRINLAEFHHKVVTLLNEQKTQEALEIAEEVHSAEARVIAEGLRNVDKDQAVVNELMESMSIREQQNLDKRLSFLGTVGSNAPFVGLLGTVLGIIQAFHDLSMNAEGGPSVVMSGIAEALVATAVGLLVAIPAVVCFNYFKNRQKQIMGNIGQLQRMLLAFVGNQAKTSNPNPQSKTI